MQFPRGMHAVSSAMAARRSHDFGSYTKPRQNMDGLTLLAEAEPLHHAFIAVGIVCLEVVEQATPLADQHEKTAARAVILLVRFEVLRQLTNTLAQQSDLDFRAARIRGMRAVLVNEGLFLLSG